MGYYTRFEGRVTGPWELMEQFVEAAENDETFGSYGGLPLQDWLDGDFFGGDTAKWYDWQKDMVEVSERFPHLLFSLQGEGEESGDIWKAWARNGRVRRAQARIVFDEPDLDADLPSPDVEKAIAEAKAAKRAEIDAEIDRLQKERATI